MSFVWQPRDQAAATLGVDAATLQQWIDAGQAPTRQNHGTLEVLIEFPDEDEDERDTDAPATVDESPRATVAASHALDVVPRRELQLAGAMAGAWQRMAEFAEGELHHSRRSTTVIAVALALLAVAAGVGIWYATRATIAARGESQAVSHRLADAAAHRDKLETARADLAARIESLTGELSEARAKLAAATEKSEQLTTAAAQQSKQHEDLVAALRAQLEDARKQLQSAADGAAALQRRIDADQAKLTNLGAELDKLKSAPAPPPSPPAAE